MNHSQSPPRRPGVLSGVAAAAALALSIGFCGAPAAAADEIEDDPPVLAGAAVLDGSPVDGIPSGPMVNGGYHVHAHLTLYIYGHEQWVPAGVGVTRPLVLDPKHDDPVITAARGFYWLHTHDESGVIHCEAPTRHDFALGQFFDIWGQPLSGHEVGPAKGDVTAWVDGKRYTGDPRKIALKDHTMIQLNVGRDVPYVPYHFPAKLP